MGKNQLKLVVPSRTSYFGGDFITGSVELVIQKQVNIREITLELFGTELCMC